MKIYVKFEIPKTVREFLKMLFSPEESGGALFRCVPTYLDEKCTKIQCDQRRSRSFREVCDCVQTYFPKVTDKTIFRILLTLNLKNSSGTLLNFYFGFCSTINKPIMYYSTSQPAYYAVHTLVNRGCTDKSWSEIFGMWKLTDEKVIKAFIQKYKDR